MASGNAQPIDAQALALLSDDEFCGMRQAVTVETQRRTNLANAGRNFASLQEMLVKAQALTCEDAKTEIRAALDRHTNARVLKGVAASSLRRIVEGLEFQNVTVASGTVKWSDATFRCSYGLHGKANHFIELLVSHGPGKTTPTGRGDKFGGEMAFKVSVFKATNDYTMPQVEKMAVTISAERATLLEGILPSFYSGGVLEAVRRFAAVSLGASAFMAHPNVTNVPARAYWLNGE